MEKNFNAEKGLDAFLTYKELSSRAEQLKFDTLKFINDPDGKPTVTLSTGEKAIDMDDAWLIIGKDAPELPTAPCRPFLRDKRIQFIIDKQPEMAKTEIVSHTDMLTGREIDWLMDTAKEIFRLINQELKQ